MCLILGYSRHSERRVTMKQDRPTLLEDFTWDVFKKRIRQYEIAPEKIEDQIAQEILIKFYDLCHLDATQVEPNMRSLLKTYVIIKEIHDEKAESLLTMLMEANDICYPYCIREATGRLLAKSNSHLSYLSPTLLPGIKQISQDGELYQLDTKIGTIHIRKASDVFQNTNSSYIFERTLLQECYARSFDFLKENQDTYRVVLSYLPTFFTTGYYHAFLTNGTEVLDIASNAFYPDKKEAEKMFRGNTLGVLSYEEVTKLEQKLLEKMYPNEKPRHKDRVLHLVAHYLHAKQKA